MKIEIKFDESDAQSVREIVERMAEHKIVTERISRNVQRNGIVLSPDLIWKIHVGCLLTTRQKTKEGSPVNRFIHLKPFPLPLEMCTKQENVADFARNKIIEFGEIPRYNEIAKSIEQNLQWLQNGGWAKLDFWLAPFERNNQPKDTERRCAEQIREQLNGFGPKQSRNLLQWLGLTQYEIPIDGRLINWLRGLGGDDPLYLLSSSALSDINYYCCILDAIQKLCEVANVLPCIFDAAVYASFES